jgi:hypothetical protein
MMMLIIVIVIAVVIGLVIYIFFCSPYSGASPESLRRIDRWSRGWCG